MQEQHFDVFLSHNNKDKVLVHELALRLYDEADIASWLDAWNIRTGSDWAREINRALDTCNVFVVFLGEHGWSKYHLKETLAALGRQSTDPTYQIIPILLPGATEPDFPESDSLPALLTRLRDFRLDVEDSQVVEAINLFRSKQRVDFRVSDGLDDEDAFRRLVSGIRGELPFPEGKVNASAIRRDARQWLEKGRKDQTILYRGTKLREAQRIARDFPGRMDKVAQDFIDASAMEEQRTKRQQRILFSSLAVISVCAIIAGILATTFGGQVGFARLGEQQANETAQVASTARVEQALTAQVAITQKAEQVATAEAEVEQAAQAIATAQADSGVTESIARKLAAQAVGLSLDQGPAATLGGLLAVEAIKRFPHLEADQALRNYLNVAAIPVSSMKFNDFITSADFSPDGKWVAVASFDGTLRVQEVDTGREITMLTTDSSFVKFSPDGKWLATIDCVQREEEDFLGVSVCASHEAHIWDTTGWYQVSRMPQGNYESQLSFSPDSKWAVSGGDDESIRVWEVSSGKVIATAINSSSFNLSSEAFSPDGKLIVSPSSDQGATIWEASTGRQTARIRHTGDVDFIAFSPDGSKVVAGGRTATPMVLDANTGDEIARMDYNDSMTNSIFSPDGSSIVSTSNDGIIVWNATTGAVISRISTNHPGFAVRFSADGKHVYSLGSVASIWDVATGVELKRVVLGDSALAFSPDGTRVAFANDDGTFYVGEFAPRQELALMSHDASVAAIAFSPNSTWIASGGDDGTTRVWDVATTQEISRTMVDGLVVDVDFSSDGKWVAQAACEGVSEGIVACGRAIVRVWEAETGEEIYHLQPDFAISSIKLTPNSKSIIITGGRGSIQLWDLATAQMVSSFEPDLSGNIAAGQAGTYVYNGDIDPTGHWIIGNGQVWDVNSGREVFRLNPEARVSLAIFSPSGKWIASAGGDNVRLWDPKDGKELMQVPVEPFTGAVSLAFSPDEKWLAGGDGTMIHIWETSTGREVARITTSIVMAVDFNSDGKWIASGGHDGSVHIWQWRPEDLFSEACFRLPRNFTHEEWNLYVGNEPYQPTCPNLPVPTE